MDYKIFLGITALLFGLGGFGFYIRDIFKGKTKPHAFSWSIWGILETIAFFAQLSRGGGAGTLPTALTAIVCFLVAGYAISRKDRQITFIDCVALAGAVIGIILWVSTKNPLTAVICVSLADAFGFVPTFRKGYYKPQEETTINYGLNTLKWVISIPALGALNATTYLYPISLILTNGAFTIMILVRKNFLKKKHTLTSSM